MTKASVLTEEDVRRLRDLASKKILDVRFEAMFYGVAAETIRRAVRGETWTKLHMNAPQTEEEMTAASTASMAKLQTLLKAEQERKTAGDKMLAELVKPTIRSPLDE